MIAKSGFTSYWRALAFQLAFVLTTVSGAIAAGAPAAPSNLRASAVSPSQVSLQFTDNSQNETGFIIQRSLSSNSGFSQIKRVGANVTSYTDSGLSASTHYYYRVAAYRTHYGRSSFSNVASAVTQASAPSPAPMPTPAPATSPSMQVTPLQVTSGQTITVKVSGVGANTAEYVALYVASNPDSAWSYQKNWKYLNGTQTPPSSPISSGTVTFPAPKDPGTYNVRYFGGADATNRLMISSNITVTATSPSPTPQPAPAPAPAPQPAPAPAPAPAPQPVPAPAPQPVPAPSASGGPVILYTDIVAGPASGGENNMGAYLSIFGKNFGSSGLGSAVRVYIGDAEVGRYILLGSSKSRSDIQQISVQVGSLGSNVAGKALPIKVVVNGVASNTDKTFMINAGRIFYVDPVKGSDSTGVAGDVTKPFKTVQASDLSKGVWGQMRAGDMIVLRAGTHVGQGMEQYFTRFMLSDHTSGKAPTGASGTGYLTLMGYPGEDAFVNCTANTNPMGCLSGLNGQTFPSAGKYVVIADLRIEGGGYDGPISHEIYGDYWRVINNEITAFTGVTSGSSPSRMAGITGNGKAAVWMGNHIHDIQGSNNEAHGIYIDGDGSYEIAYNNIHNIKSGKGFQVYVNGGNGSDYCSNVNFHHNIIHDTTQFGINIADGSKSGFVISDNIVYNAGASGLRFNTTDLVGAKIYNNTFFNNNTKKISSEAAISSDWNLPSGSMDLRNNIFYAIAGTHYMGGSVGISSAQATFANNLWYGSSDAVPSMDKAAVSGNPAFVNPTAGDFHLSSTSPAIDKGSSTVSSIVTNDYDVTTARPQNSVFDIGAFEFPK